MATYFTEGIILKRINFSEADRILTIFSKQRGKFSAIAKGVRKLHSRKGGNVEIFNQTRLLVAEGKGLDVVAEAEVIQSFPTLRRDLNKVAQAYYVMELLDKLLPEAVPQRAVYRLASETLMQLEGFRLEVGSFSPRLPAQAGRPAGRLSAEKLIGIDSVDKTQLLVRAFEKKLLILLGFWSDELQIVPDLTRYIEDLLNHPLRSPGCFEA